MTKKNYSKTKYINKILQRTKNYDLRFFME